MPERLLSAQTLATSAVRRLALALSTSGAWGRRGNTRRGSKGRDGLPRPPRGPPALLRPSAASAQGHRLQLPPSAPSARREGAAPLTRTLGRAPRRSPSAGQNPGISGNGEKGHKARGAKRRRRKGRGRGPGDSPGGGVDTKSRAGKALGVARGLQAHPRSRLPCPPLPRLPDPFQGSFFLLPSGPLRSGSRLGPGD